MAFETDNSSMPDAEVRRQEGRAYPTTWLEAWRVRARLRNGSGGRCGGGQGGVDGREGDFSSDRLMEATLRAGVPDNPVPTSASSFPRARREWGWLPARRATWTRWHSFGLTALRLQSC